MVRALELKIGNLEKQLEAGKAGQQKALAQLERKIEHHKETEAKLNKIITELNAKIKSSGGGKAA